MSDPFASLDPIQKPKTAAERVLTATPAYNHPPPPPGAPVAASPFGGGMGMDMGMHMGMGVNGMAPPGMGMHMNMGGMAPPGMGMHMNMGGMAPNMGMNMSMGMMNMGGMAPPGMGMGMNSGMGNMGQQHPFQQQQQQQQPVMYDNIKNLLQQKPKAPAAFEDSASMDFLENLGGSSSGTKTNSGSFPASNPQVRAAEPTSAVADPFGGGGGFGSSSPVSPSMGSTGGIGLSIFETGGGNTSAPTTSSPSANGGGGSKSSALADRLANGRRKTQEMQRSQLQLNANSFGSVGGAVPKISLKEMAGQTTSTKSDKTSSDMSLDDFSSGGSSSSATTSKASSGFSDSDPFGGGRGGSFGSGSATVAAPRQASFGARQEENLGPKPVDENDNTFW